MTSYFKEGIEMEATIKGEKYNKKKDHQRAPLRILTTVSIS